MHTPGPWVVDFPADGRTATTIRTDKPVCEGATLPVEVARIVSRNGNRTSPIGFYRDNARLIAAAPDLLAALKAIAEDDLLKPANLAAAHDAIAKAEGR